MTDREDETPKAARTAEGESIGLGANAMMWAYPARGRGRKLQVVQATGPHGSFTVSGQVAKALVAMVGAGVAGVTAQEVAGWAYRLGAYVHTLRRDYGLTIETVHEPHDGGWHGRYRLLCPVVIREVQP